MTRNSAFHYFVELSHFDIDLGLSVTEHELHGKESNDPYWFSFEILFISFEMYLQAQVRTPARARQGRSFLYGNGQGHEPW